MLKSFIFAIFLLQQNAIAQTVPTLRPEDELCFLNKDPGLADTGIPFLAKMGVKKGVCQGMSAIVAAFMERAEFLPGDARPDDQSMRKTVRRLMRQYRHGCQNDKVQIHGFSNLKELCSQYRDFFLKQSVLQNADIAIHEIREKLIDFVIRKDKLVTSNRDRQDMADALSDFQDWLARGRKPLMLVYSHVMTVLGMQASTNASGQTEVVLWMYNSNKAGLDSRKIQIDETDGLPTVGQRKFWDITPSRRCFQSDLPLLEGVELKPTNPAFDEL